MQVTDHEKAGITNVSRVCGKCGSKLFADAPQGLCSLCLFQTALALPGEDDATVERKFAPRPTEFDDYELLQEIGRGGQGVVYRARQKSLNRTVALKVIGVGSWATESHLRRFRREAEAAARLNHPSIVPIHEIGECQGYCYFSMNFIEGGPLDQIAKRQPLSLRRTAEIIARLARTVHYAHEHGIVHRDIKPGNILLDAQGEPHLTDFGLARLLETESNITRSTDLLGTPSYMAPEQAGGGDTEVSQATDIYSLGAVLYHLLTGQPPFAGKTTYETVRLVCEAEPRPPRLLNPIVDRDLATICLKCLEKDPQRRYSTALALAEDLERWLGHKPIRARKTGLFTRGKKGLQRNPASAVAIVLLLGLVAVASSVIWKSKSIKPPSPNGLASASGNSVSTEPAALPAKSIAVLPLQNLSEDKENAFLADGMQDELLSNLSKIKDLKVISRTSVMQYKSGAKRNRKEIAQQLGVSDVVEGSVRRSGDHVRVSVQLIDARTDQHLWGENYDRTLEDSVSLQGELATDIADAVGATLSPQEKNRVEAPVTKNPAAYDAYLRARAIPVGWGFNAEGDIEGAIHLYQEAVKLDPNFVLAWAYLSIAQIQSVWLGVDSTPARLAAAKDSLDHALALDPNLPEVHLARGYNAQDDTRALEEFRQAEKGLPNSADVIQAIARVQRALGRWDEAVAELQRAIELDPRDVRASNNLALTYCAMRRFSEALATLNRVLAWDPTNARALLTKADALVAIGDLQAAAPLLTNPEFPADRRASYALFQRNYASAVEILSKDLAVEREPRDPQDILALAFSQQLAGDLSAARATYKKAIESFRRELEKLSPDSWIEADMHARLAAAYAALGEAALAIVEGQKAMSLHPSSSYPEGGPDLEDEMARIYAQLADADHAIPMLRRLLQTSYGGATFTTPATLRLDPTWDPIRNDPRFQELTTKNAALPQK